MRIIKTLSEGWRFVKTAKDANAAMAAKGEAITLPHTWNSIDGQDGGNDYHRGTCWYVLALEKPELEVGGRAYLELNGAAMTAEVYVNGEKLARHEGGYSAFRVDITDALKTKNTIAISLDNSENTSVYPQSADFTFYGGLYRTVNLITVPAQHFKLDYCGAPGIKVTPMINLTQKMAEVTVEVWADGGAETADITVNGEIKAAVFENGSAKAVFNIENVHLWDGVNDPYLYTATASLISNDAVSVRFGCRSYEINPEKGFILNGRSYPLRGVSRHQDVKGSGNAVTLANHLRDMAMIKEIGANTVRLAHYQHAQEFYDLCDQNGIVVWAEIPYITMHMPSGRANTLSQMEELIVQCYHHPSIAVWGLSNEITAASVVNEDLLENHRLLNELCHRLDKTRPTTMANVFMLETDSPILDIPDVNSYNLYFGWYLGELAQNDTFFDEFHAQYPNRAIGFSEYGADANPQYQSAQPEKGDYTESYQALYHEHMLKMIDTRPYLWATHLWNLFDFAADGRDEGGKHGENQKGLVTFDRQTKKDAFYLYKAAWNKNEPFVHLCGSRYVYRTEGVTEIKVYSNQPEVSLYVDGKLLGTKNGKTVFQFNVPINGKHTIEAKAGRCNSVILVQKTNEENPEYAFVKRSPVLNWFDDNNDIACYSVADKLGDIRQNPEAAKIVDAMMAQAAAARGDVANAVKDNPALQRMMGRMTLIGLLKQGGADEESVKQLNRMLQKIRKA